MGSRPARSNPSLTLLNPFGSPVVRAADVVTPQPTGSSVAPTRLLVDEPGLEVGRSPIALAPGAAIPGTRYRLVRWLGDGGMGVVYEAEHVDLGRRVALKILRSEACRRPELVDMFRAEARAVARIRSDYIVEVYDFAEVADGRALFTMELLEGHTLRTVLNEGALDVSRTIAIARQICKGLAAAHDAGVVHRDIKPENVFLTRRRGRDDAVRVLDFGVSAILADAQLAASRAAGTPWYLAPERVAGLAHDGRADVYALGCTMYEMASGRRPFDGDEHEVLIEHIERQPLPLAEAAPDRSIPAAFAAVVMRCLAKHPDERFANAVDLEAALCEAQIEARLQTAWDDLAVPEVEPVRRERLLLAMPDPLARQEPHGTRWQRTIGVVGGLLVAGVAVAVMWPGRHDTKHIDDLTVHARAAAARDYFVYPPSTSPETPTAFGLVLELEDIDGFSSYTATKRAKELRREFADTLVRLGDRYWDHEAGRAFAVDYYAEALVFVPDHPIASERAPLSPGHLSELARKAEARSFSAAELAAVAPLDALAKEDPGELRAAVVELKKTSPPWSGRIEAQLDDIVEHTAPSKPAAAAAGVARPAAASAPAMPKAIDPFVDTATPIPAPAKAPAPAEAKRWLADGRSRLAAGSYAGARRAFERVLAGEPRHPGALAGLARTAYEEGHYVEAARFAERAVAHAPKKAEYVVLLGDAYFKSFRYDDAETQYRRAGALGHASAASRLAKVAAKRKR